MRESIGEFELVHAPGLAQLDVSPAEVFVHIAAAGEEDSVKGNLFEEISDLVRLDKFS